MSDEVKRQFDAFYLFVRTDEKYEEIAAQLHDMTLALEHLKTNQGAMEGRVNQGVAVTGQNNSKAIAEQSVKLATLAQTAEKLEEQINNPETGLFKQIKEIKEAVGIIYKGIAGIFFTLIAGGFVLYAFNFFKK